MPSPRGPLVQRLIRWRLLLVVNILVIAFLGVALSREVVRSRAIGAEIEALQAQADSVVTRNIDLSELRTAMQTESYIEREARLKLGMKKPGETVLVVQEGEPVSAEVLADTQGDASDPLGLVIDNQTVEPVANPTRWWYYFFDKQAFNALAAYD
ncbi:septum formation initiator family protein [Candidatus Uhrbacteria bacterium]|nr:septum formation initiator family protein [Candidatus Uhrbacteria bacterium]